MVSVDIVLSAILCWQLLLRKRFSLTFHNKTIVDPTNTQPFYYPAIGNGEGVVRYNSHPPMRTSRFFHTLVRTYDVFQPNTTITSINVLSNLIWVQSVKSKVILQNGASLD